MAVNEHLNQSGHQQAVSHAIKDDPMVKCSECSQKMRGSFGSPMVKFNGSGFYLKEK